ncbi:hypothetical protein [Bdellovibrio sp. BCCA]|uniref:hypothetical protein n=1 Tax=Bdellovibrio sp. BCCA TaxID=3136281 RepID=UPI0030F0E298
MTKVEIPTYKLIAGLIKNIAADDFQVSSQFLGQSLDPKWKSTEVIISYQPNYENEGLLSVVVIGSGNTTTDLNICKMIARKNRNIGCRVILLSDLPVVHSEYIRGLDGEDRIIAIGSEAYPRDSAETIICLAKKENFDRQSREEVYRERLMQMGIRIDPRTAILAQTSPFHDTERRVVSLINALGVQEPMRGQNM